MLLRPRRPAAIIGISGVARNRGRRRQQPDLRPVEKGPDGLVLVCTDFGALPNTLPWLPSSTKDCSSSTDQSQLAAASRRHERRSDNRLFGRPVTDRGLDPRGRGKILTAGQSKKPFHLPSQVRVRCGNGADDIECGRPPPKFQRVHQKIAARREMPAEIALYRTQHHA